MKSGIAGGAGANAMRGGATGSLAEIRNWSPRFKARLAGLIYVVAVGTAVFAVFFAPGRLGVAAIVIPVSCYVAVTLLLFDIFRSAGEKLAVLMLFFGLTGLFFEAVQWQPGHINIAMVFHGLYCALIGYLMFRSTFVPKILGVLMSVAGLVWLIYLWPSIANQMSPYNSAIGLLAEGLPMLWLLVAGVKAGSRMGAANLVENRR